jgi:ribosomal protein S4
LSLFYGTLRKSYLKKIVKLTLTEFKALKKHPTILFIQKLEARLDTTLYRTHFFYSFKNARQSISHKKIFVNNKTVQYNSYLLKKGDLITFDENIFHIVISNIVKSPFFNKYELYWTILLFT